MQRQITRQPLKIRGTVDQHEKGDDNSKIETLKKTTKDSKSQPLEVNMVVALLMPFLTKADQQDNFEPTIDDGQVLGMTEIELSYMAHISWFPKIS